MLRLAGERLMGLSIGCAGTRLEGPGGTGAGTEWARRPGAGTGRARTGTGTGTVSRRSVRAPAWRTGT